MRASIALCTYNGEQFIGELLGSLLQQSRLPDQIVICDDQSSDRTVAICRAFAEQAISFGIAVRLEINPQNRGYVRNFENALSLCDGEVLFLCDQDDIWDRDKLARYMARFESEPTLLLLHSDARLVDGESHLLGMSLFEAMDVSARDVARIRSGKALDVLLLRNVVTGATAAFRRSLLSISLPVAPGWIHDEWLAMAAAASGGVLDCMTWPSVAYRQHDGNQVGASKRAWQEKIHGEQARRAFLSTAADRLESLADRADQAGWMTEQQRHDVRRRAAHVRRRAVLNGRIFQRTVLVAMEALKGNYHRYASGFRSILVDWAGFS